jgi:thioredoxin reductase
MQRESMEFDVLVVGGGPAELAAAIRLKQLAAQPHGWQRREALSLDGSGFKFQEAANALPKKAQSKLLRFE